MTNIDERSQAAPPSDREGANPGRGSVDLSADADGAAELTHSRGFQALELAGLKLAAQGRLVALSVIAVYLLFATSGALLYNSMVYIGAFTALSVVLLALIRLHLHRAWISYLFVLLEVIVLAEALLTPNPFNPSPWPDPMVYRYDNFYYFFILIAVSVFSYSPALVLWSGLATALVWSIGLAWNLQRPETMTFADAVAELAARNAPSTAMLDAYLNPYVVLTGGRVKEMIVAVLVAGLLAVVVWRGRRTLVRLLASNRDRALLRDLFGRYVPRSVARSIEHDRGVLEPEQRVATVLFADIEGFSAKVGGMEPDEALGMLNHYFGQAAETVARFGGVVTQFQGDAMLVTFNVPVVDPDHAANGIRAGLALCDLVETRTFAGHRLNIRVGVSSGLTIAGSVGGGNRLHYTVHGEAVNLAARLEQLNKTFNTRLLVSENTHASAGDEFTARAIDNVTARGFDNPLTVYEVH